MWRNMRRMRAAIPSPPTAAAVLSKSDSVRNCATMRRLPAPSAERTAISVRRAATRARSRPATLLQAISQTMATAISRARSAGLTWRTS